MPAWKRCLHCLFRREVNRCCAETPNCGIGGIHEHEWEDSEIGRFISKPWLFRTSLTYQTMSIRVSLVLGPWRSIGISAPTRCT